LRERYRYLVLEVKDVEPASAADIIKSIVLKYFGIVGLSKVLPKLIEAYPSKGLAIVKVLADGVDLVRASMALSSNAPLRVVKVTGTERKARAIAVSTR